MTSSSPWGDMTIHLDLPRTAAELPVVAPLRGGPVLRWAVLGPGEIAHDFTSALLTHTDQVVVAVGSRSAARAESFARSFDIPRAYDSYDRAINDPSVDVVYVATPNITHSQLAVQAMSSSKHVLIEKPFAVDATDARGIVSAARATGMFAMEAMWTAFLPQTRIIECLVTSGAIGEVTAVFADFGVNFGDGEGHVFEPAGGGVLRDIGIYPLWLADWVLGEHSRLTVTGSARRVDEQAAMILDYPSGAQALLHTTMLADSPVTATIMGTAGRIEINSPFLMPDGFTIVDDDGGTVPWLDPTPLRLRDGLAWQAVAVAKYVAEGHTQAPLHTLDDALRLTQAIDEARGKLGTTN